MIEKIISLICEEYGIEEDAVNENTQLGEIVEEGADFEEIVHLLEGEFYADLSEELSEETTIGQIAEILE